MPKLHLLITLYILISPGWESLQGVVELCHPYVTLEEEL